MSFSGQVAALVLGTMSMAQAQSAPSSTTGQAEPTSPVAVASEDPVAQDSPSEVEDVVVIGSRARATTRQEVAALVQDITVTGGRHGQIGRFDRWVCPGVVGIRADYAQVLNDRIAEVAVVLGLRIGEPGCRPNILVVGARDATAINEIIDLTPDTFERYSTAIERGPAAMRDVRQPRPVRWWHQVHYRSDGGHFSRLRSQHRTDIARAIILLDMEQIGTVNFSALSDYVAMAALARLNPDADLSGQTSILNLFRDEETRQGGQGLSAWDADYLVSVYGAPRFARVRRQQVNDIVWQMLNRAPTTRD